MPLMIASFNNNTKIVKFLIENGADIHAQGDKALINACYRDNIKLAKYLLDHDADIHAQDDEAFKIANGNKELFDLLNSYLKK